MIRKILKKINETNRLFPVSKPVKAYANWLRANYEMARQAISIKAKPIKLTIEGTNICHLKCPFCPTGKREHDRPLGRAQKELFSNLLMEVGDCLFFIDFFNWGEPLMNRDILWEWVAMAHNKNIYTTISTHLSMELSENDVDTMLHSGLHQLIVSLDGASQKTYGTYRKGGDFQLVMNNLEKIVKRKKALCLDFPRIIWQFLVFGFNECEMDDARERARALGIEEIRFLPPYIDTNTRDGITWISSQYILPAKIAPTSIRHNRCDWHYISSAINWDGTLSPCCALYKQSDDFGFIGKAGNLPYMSAVNSEKYRSARRYFASGKKTATNLACERCHLPDIMPYRKELNKQILFILINQILHAIKSPFKKLLRAK